MTEFAAPEKPQWHFSHLESLLMCGKRYDYGYQQGLRAKPGVAAATGSVVHLVAALNLTRKAETSLLVGAEELDDLTRDAFRHQWDLGVHLLPEEVEMGLQLVQGRALDRSIALARLHAAQIAPRLRPKIGGIERKWVVHVDSIDGEKEFPWDLAGEIDVEEDRVYAEDGETILYPSAIRDLKTKGKKPTQHLAGSSHQLSMYSVDYHARHGEWPDRVFFDYAMANDAAKAEDIKVDAGIFGSTCTPERMTTFWETLEAAAKVVEAQAFLPSRPGVDWWCSERWCGFARIQEDTGKPICKHFYSAPTFVALSFTGNSNGDSSNGNGIRRATATERKSLFDEL